MASIVPSEIISNTGGAGEANTGDEVISFSPSGSGSVNASLSQSSNDENKQTGAATVIETPLATPRQRPNIKDRFISKFSATARANVERQLTETLTQTREYVYALEALLTEHNIELPALREELIKLARLPVGASRERMNSILQDTSQSTVHQFLLGVKALQRKFYVTVSYRNLGVSTMVTKTEIPTVGTTLRQIFLGPGPKTKVDLLNNITGRIAPHKMTLLLGPPGSGKSIFLKTLSGRMTASNVKFHGEIKYNDDDIHSNKFLFPKVAEYIEQGDTHAPTLTVEETIRYAWMSVSGGHHSYGFAANDEAAKKVDERDHEEFQIKNILKIVGLEGVKDTYVGNAAIRGVSGGQKRRVTSAEFLVSPRIVKFMDCISNGLDTATTYDILRAIRQVCKMLGSTNCISLLQPPPEVFDLFDEIILLSDGEVIYHGPREEILDYFVSLGYECPDNMDLADFLQVLPTPEGKNYVKKDSNAPRGTAALVEVWKKSPIYHRMLQEMELEGQSKPEDIETGVTLDGLELTGKSSKNNKEWPKDTQEQFAGSYWFHFKLALERQYKLTIRDTSFLASRIGQNVVIGAIGGSLFSNIPVEDTVTLNGVLFFTALTGALTAFAMLPLVFEQKAIYYKHGGSLFYPTSCFTIAQALVLVPLHILETIVFTVIMYWSAGLSDEYSGSRFLTFVIVVFVFSMAITQLFRTIAFATPTVEIATPMAGISLILMVLFSGFIQPFNQISYGWKWFYWMNPIAYVLKAVTVNELKSSKYDFLSCIDTDCTAKDRFGDIILKVYGNPTDEKWIWYCFAVLIGEYLFLFIVSTLILQYVRTEVIPPAPIRDDSDEIPDVVNIKELPFEPASFAFRDIGYTVKTPAGEELELLKDITGYFEPGTITALMGSSGAGKTTLLDVLSGRKNTGTVRGEIFVNGHPKNENHFRRIMAYVEQFDSLSPHDTAREAIEFSAALRLPTSVTNEERQAWVEAVLAMMELKPIENMMVGSVAEGGMSFEQKKRVSIGVELAANPAILFLDEPTTGLDSRAAQVVMRSIRRVAASGRCIVCTIHQPSYPIFANFDSLLLLRRGGQTVFFGELGKDSENLINFFQSAPHVTPIAARQNPATWMLEVIGAGTNAVINPTDFYVYYMKSTLCEANLLHAEQLFRAPEGETSKQLQQMKEDQTSHAQTGLWHQFKWVTSKVWITYWRTPSYNFVRNFVSVLVALIFASAYSNQGYSTYSGAISRSAVIYITTMFLGIIGMQTVITVASLERPAFYREQQSNMYSVAIYSIANAIVEIPYIIVSALVFTLPFFFIVGFQNVGPTGGKFLYFWLFQGLYVATLVYFGQFFAAALPTQQAAAVIAGVLSTILTLFCGFMITQPNFPKFWLFMYWLNPLRYTLEGLFMSQFHGDDTEITLLNGDVTTAEKYITEFFSPWHYENIGLDILAMFIFIIVLRVATYLSLKYQRHDKR